jgi:hypothetical protein
MPIVRSEATCPLEEKTCDERVTGLKSRTPYQTMALIERLVELVIEVDRANLYLPPSIASLLRIHGFMPHRTYTRPPRPPRPPPPVRLPCPGVTRAGTPCKNKCAFGCTTCRIHAANPTPRGLPAQYERCPEMTKGGTPCKCSKYKEYPMCWRHAKKANLLPPAPEVPTECAVCYCDLTRETTTKTACGHHFHIACFETWRQSRTASFQAVTCPMCRHANPRPKPLVRRVVGTVHQSSPANVLVL